MKLSSNGDLLGGNRISSGASVRKQSNRLIEQSADKVIQAVVDKFKEDEDIQNLLRHHSIIAANLEEKMKGLIAATTRIEDLERRAASRGFSEEIYKSGLYNACSCKYY